LGSGLFREDAPQRGRSEARVDALCPGFCRRGRHSGGDHTGTAGPHAATRARAAGAPAFTSQGASATPLFLDEAVVFSFKVNAHAHLIVEL